MQGDRVAWLPLAAKDVVGGGYQGPFGITGLHPGEEKTFEVPVQVTATNDCKV